MITATASEDALVIRRGWWGGVDWNVVGEDQEGPRGTERERRDQHCQHCVSEADDGAAASQDSQASLDEVDECLRVKAE
eukprot:3831419-Prymnesium_polylepis.1